MKFKIPKQLLIINETYKVTQDKSHNGGSFCMQDGEIIIGTNALSDDSGYTFGVLMHEISEVIHIITSTRYRDGSCGDNYKFFLDHKEFDNHNAILSGIIINQLIL